MNTDKTLATRVQALPPELFDRVLDFVLETPACVVKITKEYRPPIALQINRSSRKEVAQRYYVDTVFEVTDNPMICERPDEVPRGKVRRSAASFWLASLNVDHRFLLGRVHYSPRGQHDYTVQQTRVYRAMRTIWDFEDELSTCNVNISDNALYAKLLIGAELGGATEAWNNQDELYAIWKSLRSS